MLKWKNIAGLIIFILLIVFNVGFTTNIEYLKVYSGKTLTNANLINEVLVGDNISIGASLTDYPVSLAQADSFEIEIYNTAYPNDTISVWLERNIAGDTDSSDSHIYTENSLITIKIVELGLTNNTKKYIAAKPNSGQTITIKARPGATGVLTKNITISVPQPPAYVYDLHFSKTGFSEPLSNNEKIDIKSTLNLELSGTDGNPLTIDTVPVYLSNKTDIFTVVLTETSKNSGLYRNSSWELYDYTNSSLKKIKATYGDTLSVVLVSNSNDSDLLYVVEKGTAPSVFYDLHFSMNSQYNQLIPDNEKININSRLYIELSAEDAEPLTVDTVPVYLSNSSESFIITLTETSKNSGLYRNGEWSCYSYSSETLKRINADYSDSISVMLVPNTNYRDDLSIIDRVNPAYNIHNITFTTENYTRNLYDSEKIIKNSNLYIKAVAEDTSSITYDSILVLISNRTNGETLFTYLMESSSEQGVFYSNSVLLTNYTNKNSLKLKAEYGDSITVENMYGKGDTVEIASPQSPNVIDNINFMDVTYSEVLSNKKVHPRGNLYIQLNAIDNDIYYSDEDTVWVMNLNNGDSIFVNLKESEGINSGIFKIKDDKFVTLAPFTNNNNLNLKADFGDAIILLKPGSQAAWDQGDSKTINGRTVSINVAGDTLYTGDTIYGEIYNVIYVSSNVDDIPVNSLTFMKNDFTEIEDTFVPSYYSLEVLLLGGSGEDLLIDQIPVLVENTYGDTLSLILTETKENSGEYQGLLNINSFTYSRLNFIKAVKNNDTVVISYKDKIDTVIIKLTAPPNTPDDIVSIKFKNSGYTQDLDNDLNIGEEFYIEITGNDTNAYTVDKVILYVKTVRADESTYNLIRIVCEETEKNSGIFRGKGRLAKLSNDTLDDIEAHYGDIILAYIGDLSTPENLVMDTAYVTVPKQPTILNELSFYSESYGSYLESNYQAYIGEVLYIQATAEDSNPLNADTLGVLLLDATVDNRGGTIMPVWENRVEVALTETGEHTGIFRGNVTLGRVNSNFKKILGTNEGNKILVLWISSIADIYADTSQYSMPISIYDRDYTNSDTSDVKDIVDMVKYNPPDFVYSLTFMKDQSFNQPLLTPHLSDVQVADPTLSKSSLSYLSRLYIEAIADTRTASPLLNDQFEVRIKVYEATSSGELLPNNRIGLSLPTGSKDTGTPILLKETAPNSGRYTNIDDVKNLIYYENNFNSISDVYVRPSGDTMKVIIVVEPSPYHQFDYENEAKYNLISGKTRPPQSINDTNLISVDTSYLAFKIVPSSVNKIELCEDNGFINPLSYKYRTFNSAYEKLYVRAFTDSINGKQMGDIQIDKYSNTVIRDDFYIILYLSDFYHSDEYISNILNSDYGDTYIIVNLLETDVDSKKFIVNTEAGYAIPRVVTRDNDITPNLTSQQNFEIHAMPGDRLKIRPLLWEDTGTAVDVTDTGFINEQINKSLEETYEYSFGIAINRQPDILSITKMNAGYSEINSKNFLFEDRIYLEVRGRPLSSDLILKDSVAVDLINYEYVSDTLVDDSITIVLWETDVNSEIYHVDSSKTNYPQISSFTNQATQLLIGSPGDDIRIIAYGHDESNTRVLITNVAQEQEPTDIYGVSLKRSSAYLKDLIGSDSMHIYLSRDMTIYAEIKADPGDRALIDRTYLKAGNSRGEYILVELVETKTDSIKYRGTFKITNLTNDTLDELGVNDNETFTVWYYGYDPVKDANVPGHENKTIISGDLGYECKVPPPLPPFRINSIAFKDASYNETLKLTTKNTTLPYSTLYIEANGEDQNARIQDALDVYLTSYSEDRFNPTNVSFQGASKGEIKVSLKETDLHTGKFQGIVTIGDYFDTDQRMVKATNRDIILITGKHYVEGTNIPEYHRAENNSAYDTVFIPVINVPDQIFGITLRTEDYSQLRSPNKPITLGEILYIEAQGDVSNTLLIDTTSVTVRSYDEEGKAVDEVEVELIESAPASGSYRGKVKIAESEFVSSLPMTNDYKYKGEYTATSNALSKNNSIKKAVVTSNPIPVLGSLSAAVNIKIIWQHHTGGDTVFYPDPNAVGGFSTLPILKAAEVMVIPNPYKKGTALYSTPDLPGISGLGEGIVIVGLSKNTEVNILDTTGRLVRQDRTTANMPGSDAYYYFWDLKNNENKTVSSGIYIYSVTDINQNQKVGKLAIIR